MTDFITFLISDETLTKQHTAKAEGGYTTTPYDRAHTFGVITAPVNSLNELYDVLSQAQEQPNACAIHGEPIDPSTEGTSGIRRLLYGDLATGDKATLKDAAEGHHWIVFDLDDVAAPAGLNPECDESLQTAVRSAIVGCLPDYFHAAPCVYQWTSGAGVKGWGVLRLRLWFWADRKVKVDAIRAELKPPTTKADPALWNPVQIIYTAAPKFYDVNGEPAADILSGKRMGLLEGASLTLPATFGSATTEADYSHGPSPSPSLSTTDAKTLSSYTAKALEGVYNDIVSLKSGNRHGSIIAGAKRLMGLLLRGDMGFTEADALEVLRRAAKEVLEGERDWLSEVDEAWNSARSTVHEPHAIEFLPDADANDFLAALRAKAAAGEPLTKAEQRRLDRSAERAKRANPAKSVVSASALGVGFLNGPAPKPHKALLTYPGSRLMPGKLFMPAGRVSLLVAPGGTGKSTTLNQLAWSVASGKPWLDVFDVATPGKVLVLMGEEDTAEIERMIYYGARSVGLLSASVGEQEQALNNLIYYPLAGVPVALQDEGNDETAFFERLLEFIEDNGPFALIIIDPLSRFAGPEAEVDNASATRFVQGLEELTQTPGGPAVVAAHHTNKNALADGATASQGDSRGSSAFVDGSRCVVNLARARALVGAEGVKHPRISIQTTKTNYGPPMHDALEFIRGENGFRPLTTAEADAEHAQKEAEEAERLHRKDVARAKAKVLTTPARPQKPTAMLGAIK